MAKFCSSLEIILAPDQANDLLQLLESSMPLPPQLRALHQNMMVQASLQEERPRELDFNVTVLNAHIFYSILFWSWGLSEWSASDLYHNALNSRNMLPTPEPSLTPVTVRSHSVASDMQCPSEQRTLPSYTSTNRRRCRTEDTLSDHDGSLRPPTKRHRSSSCAGIGSPRQPDHEGETSEPNLGVLPQPEPEGEPPEPFFNPPRIARPPRKCPRGACRLRINVNAARRPEEHEDDGDVEDDDDEEEDEEVEEEAKEKEAMEGEDGEDENGERGEYGEGDEVRDDRDIQPVGGAQVQRGSWRRRASDEPRISCSDKAATIIAELASAHCTAQTPYVEDESLSSVVARCRGIVSKDICTNFLVMVNYMTLVCKCQSIRLKTGLHLKGIHAREIEGRPLCGVSYRTFLDWHSVGSKFIAIASGGSIYALVLIAGLGLRVSIASMVGPTHLHLADMLRSPPKGSLQRQLITDYIAPTIARMRSTFPLTIASMFSRVLIERYTVSKNVDCTDLSASDRFFDAIIQNLQVWRVCIAPVGDLTRVPVQSLNHKEFYGSSRPYSPPLSDVEEDEIEHIIIKTSYDPLSPKNKHFKAPRDRDANTKWTAVQRLCAESGERVSSIDALRKKLAAMYKAGVKKSPESYLRIPMSIIPNHHLELRNKDGSLMAFVSTGLPSHIRSSLEGHDAPSDVQPWLLEKDSMRTNHGQMETYLQEEFEMLMEVASVLPGNCMTPVAPFISLVININVSTKAHRDSFDRHLCLVIPIGHFEGGALCLLENGLVLELRPGDIALFRSSEVTHFNLDYWGTRASLVFQTDKEFASWVKDRNGWVDNATMHSFV
ncbi:hypothetical protein BDR05DRAFT_953861 [Suillus weaverae]|nr:hypothetical protein BDR05DRAFT_953861 [Suillus weaverae]